MQYGGVKTYREREGTSRHHSLKPKTLTVSIYHRCNTLITTPPSCDVLHGGDRGQGRTHRFPRGSRRRGPTREGVLQYRRGSAHRNVPEGLQEGSWR